jgi:hypothetical protein
MWLKTSLSSAVKTNLNRFGEPAFFRLTSIRPKPGNETTYKDAAPLVLRKGQIYVTMFSMLAMWLKKKSKPFLD